MRSRVLKYTSIALVVSMLATLSIWTEGREVQAANSPDYRDMYIQPVGMDKRIKIVNGAELSSWNQTSFETPYDMERDDFDDGDDVRIFRTAFEWFYEDYTRESEGKSGIQGVYTDQENDIGFHDNHPWDSVSDTDGTFVGKIRVKEIPELKQLAEGGQARYLVKVYWLDDAEIWSSTSTGGSGEWHGDSEVAHENVNSGWRSFGVDDDIIIRTYTEDGTTDAVEGIRIYFADWESPTMKDYTFKTDGVERPNSNIQQQELLVKKNANFQLDYNFSEAVKASNSMSATTGDSSLISHNLFTVPTGEGLPTDGNVSSMGLPPELIQGYTAVLPYTFNATEFIHTGNNPIESNGEITISNPVLNKMSLHQKISEAGFYDAAGNPLNLDSDFDKKVNSESIPYLHGKTVNPFDYANGGYRIIVDAVPPRYSLTANGIQPDILTGSTLNKGDTIDFKVQLSEETILNEDIARMGGTYQGLHLYFNNGMKANYVSGQNTKTWLFRAPITEEITDVALLKAIALTHESKGDHSDKGVIQDYAGNLLMDSAYADKVVNEEKPGLSTSNTKIDWAKLAIDNTKPSISFRYDASGATDTIYKRSGKMTIDANDPSVKTNALDPDQSVPERPSRGIYRPNNMTGNQSGNSSNVGLVFYYWSKSPNNPLAGYEADNFAAIKRFSLAGKQPYEGLYPTGMNDFEVDQANNKTNVLLPPEEALTAGGSGKWYLHTWTADMTWDTARELMQDEKVKTFKDTHAAKYEEWIQEYKTQTPGGSDVDAEKYAMNKVLGAAGKYSDLSVWPLSDFKRDDSNWVYNVGEISLDNKLPTLTIGTANGNETAEVTVPIVIADSHSGLNANKLLFQWVKAGGKVSNIGWKVIPENADGSRTVTTLNHVDDDGDYELYVKVEDMAGNTTSAKMEGKVNVKSSNIVKYVFEPEASSSYVQSHDVAFGIKGIQIDKAEYAFGASSTTRPAASLYKDITSSEELRNGHHYYGIPANKAINGERYLHIRVKEKDQNRYLYYVKSYRFDNKAPDVSFSPTSSNYAKEKHSVVVSVNESLSVQGTSAKYQWIKSSDSAPTATSTGWLALPENGQVVIDDRNLEIGETANYKLYVHAVDGAGNDAIKPTGDFKVIKKTDAEIVVNKADVIYAYGDATDGYYAILNLELDNTSKEGFEHSVSTDDGVTWSSWAPYSNFVKVEVGGTGLERLNKLKARFRTPTGKESEPVSLSASGNWQEKPVYGIAVHNTLGKTNEVMLDIEAANGISIAPSADVNPSVPERMDADTFKVTQNGLYSFELQDTVNEARKATLIVVVSNVDNAAPTGEIVYSVTKPTSSNVLAELKTSEPVRITNNEGRSSFLFTENGSFSFEFEDEGGSKGTATATVANIDRTPPNAVINKSYSYQFDNELRDFKTIEDANGNVVLAQGVTLELDKADENGKDFNSVSGGKSKTLYGNDKAKFIIRDDLGNVAVLSEEVDYIVSSLPDPEVEYQFVDDQGMAIPLENIKLIDGVPHAKGKVKVTIKGQVAAPNEIFVRGGPNQRISDGNGSYQFTKLFDDNGEMTIVLTDLVGNLNRVRIKTAGLDNTAPTIELKSGVVAVQQNKPNLDPAKDLGGYTVSDNVSDSEALQHKVSISGLDLSKIGPQTVTYTVQDEVGNTATATQKVVVMKDAGLLIVGNGQLISSMVSESILYGTNEITFRITGFDEMPVNGQKSNNALAQYDLYSYSGLYREGQMKVIADKLTMKQLSEQQFKVTFPDTGWYTIVVRTQEREREYAMFFIGKMKKQVGK
ncbi:hypothetical protein [Cohnella herbarum]|uniref:DUF5011 domain-containing protein n=1 Tax=Cohnella herbarum TaxID=2728023 RepID=A0A7Z2VK95_9BACL|nr:hypothetical protein [Cohnella herbarum]QJD84597.1 DUF5011 domain-containing protein [Cohnella herbarum]